MGVSLCILPMCVSSHYINRLTGRQSNVLKKKNRKKSKSKLSTKEQLGAYGVCECGKKNPSKNDAKQKFYKQFYLHVEKGSSEEVAAAAATTTPW